MEKLLYTGKAKQMWQTEDPDVFTGCLPGSGNDA